MLISPPTINSQSTFNSLVDTRINRTSMVPTCLHNRDLLLLTGDKISSSMIQYVAQKFIYAIAIDEGWQNTLPSPPPTPTKPPRSLEHVIVPILPPLPPLEEFIAGLVQRSGAQVATLMSTLIYLQRLQDRISSDVKGMLGTRHRIFLATLIVAAKYLNDSGPKNIHWATYARCFDMVEINMMENQLLTILNYGLRFDEAEACRHFAPFMGRSSSQNLVRQSALFRVVEGFRAREPATHLPLTPPPSEGSTSDDSPRWSRRRSSQLFLNASKCRSGSYRHRSSLTSIISSSSLSTHAGGEISNPTNLTLTSIGNMNELEKAQTAPDLFSLSNERETVPGPQDSNPFVLRAIPATARRKSRTQRFNPVGVDVISPANKKAFPTISGQRLSRKSRERTSIASKSPFDDLWRKIQSNLSKLTLVNSDSQSGSSVVFNNLKQSRGQSEAENGEPMIVC